MLTTDDNKQNFRVWHIANVPGKPFHVFCNQIEEARKIRDLLADYDLHLGDLIESNAQGIEERIPGPIIKNAAECGNCHEVIESTHRHDYVSCGCGGISVDGGKDYFRRAWRDGVEIIDRSENGPDEWDEIEEDDYDV